MTDSQAADSRARFHRDQYVQRINSVFDFNDGNIDGDLSLRNLASVAGFSPFHFHRIFHAMVGETLNHFRQRIRVERAATQLINNPKKSITDIALACGFSSSATFARAFKEAFGMSATEWRAGGHRKHRNARKMESNAGQGRSKLQIDSDTFTFYIDGETQNLVWRMKVKDGNPIQIEVKDMPELHVAYVRHTGPYQGDSQLFGNLFEKLMTWAGPRGLLRFPETMVLCVYHDDPDVTEADKLRVSACITVPEDTAVDGEIGKMAVAGGKFAVARFELGPDEYGDAWDFVYGRWLPQSGYQPDDRLCYELYHGGPGDHPEGKHVVDICVPVRPL